MTDSLKKKTVSSLIWNAIDKAGFQIIALIVGIITARLLSPNDFGLIGALAIFTLFSNILIESGFTSTLVRREKNTNEEYSAVFLFNTGVSIFVYLILFFSAPFIADFFRIPELKVLSRFLFLAVIINSFGLIQNIILTKELAFRLTSIANIVSALVSGAITIGLAIAGYGYWALAWQLIIQSIIRVLMLWKFSFWKFSLKTDFSIIKEVYSFSLILIITSLINTIVKNIYNIIIGRYFSIQQLGYYYQANKFQQIPSNVISLTMSGVAFPVLSKLNPEPERQLLYFRKIMRITAFLLFPLMIGLLSLTQDLFSIILTDKWLPAVPYFQILVFMGIAQTFHILNLNLIVVKGHKKLSFSLEMFKNILTLISLIFCIKSIELMLIGFAFATILSYCCDLIFVQKEIGYKAINQITDILPYGIISAGMFVAIKLIGMLPYEIYIRMTLQILGGAAFYLITINTLGSKILKDAVFLLRNKRIN